MPTKVKIPTSPRKVKTVAVALRKDLKDIADEIKEELDKIVAPFNSNIDVIVVNKTDSRDYIVEIMGNPNDSATTNAANQSVTSHDLLKFLDGGTDIQYVGMPEGFENETRPNSKDTTSKSYDREGIYFLPDPITPGIAARNWFSMLIEDYKEKIPQRFDSTLRRYLH